MSLGEPHAALSVGIIGTGFMGRVHARAVLANGAVLAGVSSSTADNAERAAADLGARRSYAHNLDLIGDPSVQVVHICTPNHLHADLVRAAIGAGKHVVCEKPLATEPVVARELERLARTRGVVATVPYVYRFLPMVREARALVAAGELGRLTLVHGSYLQDWLLDPAQTNWRVDSGLGGRSRSFADIGSHWCDLVEFVTGERIEAVSAQLRIVADRRPDPSRSGATFSSRVPESPHSLVGVDTEDIAIAQLRMTNGLLGSIVVSQVAAGHKNHLQFEILGTSASLQFDQQQPDRIRIGTDRGVSVMERDPERLSPAAVRYSRLPAGHAQGYQDCVDAFVGDTYRAVRGEVTDPTLPTFASGVRAAAITDAVLISARSGGGWVPVGAAVDGDVDRASELSERNRT